MPIKNIHRTDLKSIEGNDEHRGSQSHHPKYLFRPKGTDDSLDFTPLGWMTKLHDRD